METPIPETSTEITTETSSEISTHIEKARVPYEQIVDTYNQICKSLPKVQQISDKRKRAIKKMLAFAKDKMELLEELFCKVEQSDFLAGRTKEWQANFDWIMRPDIAVKILEGQYANRTPKNGQGFSNMIQHGWDMDELERQADKYMEQTF